MSDDAVRYTAFDQAEDALMRELLCGSKRVDFLSYEEYGALNRLRVKFDLPEMEGMNEEMMRKMSSCHRGCD